MEAVINTALCPAESQTVDKSDADAADSGLMAAAATTAAASAAAHWRQGTESGVAGFAARDGGEH